MRLKIAAALLMAWLVGVVGPFSVGSAVHGLLLAGLMFLLLAVVADLEKARSGERHEAVGATTAGGAGHPEGRTPPRPRH